MDDSERHRIPDTRYTVFNALLDIVLSPGRALDAVRNRTGWLWWPLGISMAVPSLVFAWYYNWVDYGWLVEESVRNLPAERRAAEAEQVRGLMSRNSSIRLSVAGIVILTLVVYSLQAAWLHAANRFAVGARIRYRQWFSFSAWTGFVGVFGSLAMLAAMLLSDTNRLGREALAPLSINALFVQARAGEPWYTWARSLTLINLWMLSLMTLGFARWTGASLIESAAIAVLPWAALYGIWALLI